MRQLVNIVIGAVLSFIVVWMLWGLGEAYHLDLSYDELDRNAQIELWVWRGISTVVGVFLFAWVVRKNTKA